MATEKQINANQRNAKLSHGPTTPEGLLASQINNFRHGLAIKTHEHFGFLYDENSEKFDQLHTHLTSEHNPTTETEGFLVRHMAEHEWLRSRALRFQADCLEHGVNSKDADKLPLFIRYQTTHERAFYRALNELQKLRNERAEAQIGIEAQDLKKAAGNRAAEAHNLKPEEFLWKKEIVQMKRPAREQRNATQVVPETASDGLKMAA